MANDDLSRLENLEVRLYKLTTRSHVRVGAGEGTADVATDNPIIRALLMEGESDRRVPYLPGSSLHGVIRAWAEKALRSSQEPLTGEALQACVDSLDQTPGGTLLDKIKAEYKDSFGNEPEPEQLYQAWRVYTAPHVCNPLSDVDKCERVLLTSDQGEANRWKINWWQALDQYNTAQNLNHKVMPPCAVCRIFGYMGQRGRVKFSHAWPTTEAVLLDVITRVAINRLTGAADEGKLFDLEAIPPGVSFHFFTVMENMNQTDKDRFEMGLRALNLQLAGVGAHSTVGFGAVDVEREFRVTLNPGLFSQDIQPFIRAQREAVQLDQVAFDQTKFPAFFQALVAAKHAGESSCLDGLIQFN